MRSESRWGKGRSRRKTGFRDLVGSASLGCVQLHNRRNRKLNEEWLKLIGAYFSQGRNFRGVSSMSSMCLAVSLMCPRPSHLSGWQSFSLVLVTSRCRLYLGKELVGVKILENTLGSGGSHQGGRDRFEVGEGTVGINNDRVYSGMTPGWVWGQEEFKK